MVSGTTVRTLLTTVDTTSMALPKLGLEGTIRMPAQNFPLGLIVTSISMTNESISSPALHRIPRHAPPRGFPLLR